MPKISDLSPEKRFMGLFIGRSGSGKTVAEGSFPKPIEFWDFDGRIRGLLGAPWLDMTKDAQYEYFLPKDPELLKKLNDKLNVFDSAGRVSNLNYLLPRTLVLDSLTSAAFAMVMQSLPITHAKGKGGTSFGQFLISDPADYKMESQSMKQIVAFFRSLPIENIIVSAHIIPKWGKKDPTNQYSESIEVGEKLSITDRLGEDILIYFDHVFRFERREGIGKDKFTVKFHTDLARTSYSDLPYEEVDITGKNFYETMMSYVKKPSLEVVNK